MAKLPFILGAGVGYVLGTRAGRGQYERIKRAFNGLVNSGPAQAVSKKADETVGEYARQKATALTDSVADAVKGKINSVGHKDSGTHANPTLPDITEIRGGS